jgi:acetoin utilization deacetylase AcuC-like enzyme
MVGWSSHPVFSEHDAGPGHPERPERLEAVRRGLREAGLQGDLLPLTARAATREELLRVHTPAHVDGLAAAAGRHVRIDPDTSLSPRSHEAAVRAAGAVVEAVERVLDGGLDRAFCSVRPPGHHATPGRAMGFCLFNNVAVGAAAALARGLKRVAIVDFDVHHGNGTQEAFWTDPRVLYVSSHQFPFYPGTGALDEVGEGEGRGFTVNLPLAPGTGDAEYAQAYREIVEPVGRAFDPELVLVSAGFDPIVTTPGGMTVTAGFAELAGLAWPSPRGPLAASWPYSRAATTSTGSASTAAVVGRMLDRPGPKPGGKPVAGFEKPFSAFRATHGRYWPVLSRPA